MRRQVPTRGRRAPKRNGIVVSLFCMGVAGIVCFTALIAMDVITSRQDEAYYASSSASLAHAASADPAPGADEDDDYDGYDDDDELLYLLLGGGDEYRDNAKAENAKVENVRVEEVVRTSAMNFEPIRKNAPDVAAWIRISGTMLDYPVMYGTDNEFYLNHLPNGQKSKSGSVFIDYRNSPNFTNPNTLLHGHRMKSGAIFGTLRNYRNQSYYNKYPTVSIFTPRGDFELRLFAGYVLNQMSETPPMYFDGAESFDEYIKNIKKRSVFKSNVEVNYGDRLVSLSTCEYSVKDGRLIIVGKLVERN